MVRFSRILSLVLLALWFPATQCCALEAAGVALTVCCDEDCASEQSCSTEACANGETTLYKSNTASLKVSAPELRDCSRWAVVPKLISLLNETAALPSAVFAQPRDWIVVWHFVRRAAPPSRAPAFLSV